MNDTTKDGGPAFPTPFVPGMTLRDYFAAKAMQGLIAQSLGTALDASISGRELGRRNPTQNRDSRNSGHVAVLKHEVGINSRVDLGLKAQRGIDRHRFSGRCSR